jgi:ferredoxin-thioredoxin reductase catalytic subunit
MKIPEKFKSKNAEEFEKDSKEYAINAGIKVNPDKKVVDNIIKGMFKNKESKGEFYCPCRVTSGNKEKDKELICPCVFHRGEIELEGHCRCFLFVGK